MLSSMSDQLILIVGLPGSGKTTYLSGLNTQNTLIFDDFNNLDELPLEIPTDKVMYVAAPNLCAHWQSALAFFSARYPVTLIRVIFFENDVESAIHNVRGRDERLINEQYIRWLSSKYVIPPDVDIIPIVRKS